MKTFPMFLKTTGRRIVILGGGEQAAQKARLALKTDAALVMACAPAPEPELAGLIAEGRAHRWTGPATPALFERAALVFVATGCPGADAALAACARAAGAPVVNVVDAPALCDAFTPAIVDRDPVVVAIGTEGTAPVLGRRIKTEIETMLEPRLGALAALAGRLRGAVAQRLPRAQHRTFWRWVFSGEPRRMHAAGQEHAAAQAIKRAIASPETIGTEAPGFVSLVGAGPGSRDLLTLRAVQRLQEADVIYYDRLVDPDVLELARRDAERVYVGKAPGAHAWPQELINSVIAAAARAGRRVVRLKSGDPGIFGRAAEEIAALNAAGVAWEIVPGITAAAAAAASAGSVLTERGRTDALVLATAHCRAGAPPPNLAARLLPGTTLAIYMGAARAGEIRQQMLEAGLPPDLPVDIVLKAETAEERRLGTTIEGLERSVAEAGHAHPAMILIRRPALDEARSVAPSTCGVAIAAE